MTQLALDIFYTPLPERIVRLRELAYNLWWSWHPEAQDLYRQIDPDLWELVYHNPVVFLREVREQRLDQAAGNQTYLQQFDTVLAQFDTYMRDEPNRSGDSDTIAYFSAEFGLHESLPIYSGGLGILAGDHVKTASDMQVPLVAVGFLYPQGYFRQQLDEDGMQIAAYQKIPLVNLPVLPARTPEGKEVVINVELAGRLIYAKIYRIQVGRTPLFLMDTDIHPNNKRDRELSARLYVGDQELRLAQEMMLGIGGVRALRKLGIDPAVWHMNEGHAAFLVLELLRELVAQKIPIEQAMQQVRECTVFTTHTPTHAASDAFSPELIKQFFWRYWPQLNIGPDEFMNLARKELNLEPTFSMTALALNHSNRCNGVSKLHGHVARGLWQWMYPGKSQDEVPIGSITNGVHSASWLAPELQQIYDTYLPQGWEQQLNNPKTWQGVYDIPNDVLWSVRRRLRQHLVEFVRTRERERWQRLGQTPDHWPVLDEDALTIGFARRFASYKRATLILRDLDRLKALLNDPGRPIQILFAGKAQPADEIGKHLIQEIYQLAQQPDVAGRIVFLEEYDIAVGREMVRGVDVWLNTPRRPFEASGTSGQKASLNGIPNLSVLDGWWAEAYNGQNGWAIGDGQQFDDQEEQDWHDAQLLYNILEQHVVPLFYDQRDAADVPAQWIQICKEAIVTIAPQFSSQRMLTEYMEQFYDPIITENT